MICEYCGEELEPTDSLESPITGEIVSPEYMCPNFCDYIAWLEDAERAEGRKQMRKSNENEARETLRYYGFEEEVLKDWTDEECEEQLEAIEMYPEG